MANFVLICWLKSFENRFTFAKVILQFINCNTATVHCEWRQNMWLYFTRLAWCNNAFQV